MSLKIPEKTPEEQKAIDDHVDGLFAKFKKPLARPMPKEINFPDILGKTIAHVEIENWDGHEAMNIEITFKDHSKLMLQGEIGYEYNYSIVVTYKK